MSRTYSAVAVSLLLSFGSMGSEPAHAGDFEEFRVPEHTTLHWTGSINGAARWSRLNSLGWYDTRNETVARAGTAMGVSALDWARDTDPASTSLSVESVFSGSHTSDDRDRRSTIGTRSLDFRSRSRNQQLRERVTVVASRTQFHSFVPLAWRARVEGQIDDVQGWDSRDEHRIDRDTTWMATDTIERATRAKQYVSTLYGAIGIGLGRVRDATGVYEAMILERRLAATGVLARPLTAQARHRLAALMYVRGPYAGTTDRPARDIWEEIARILEADGAITSPLSSATTLRLMEPFHGRWADTGPDGLPDSPVTRQTGASFFVEILSRHRRWSDHRHYNELTASSSSALPPIRYTSSWQSKATSDDLLVMASVDLHRPLGYRWQAGFAGRAEAPARHGLSATYDATATVIWIVADRWLGSVGGSHRWFDEKRTIGPTGGDQASWSASAKLLYLVEPRTALSLGLAHSDDWVRGRGAYNAGHRYGRSTQVTAGVSYRFTGRFSAPQLALAPSPPTIDLQP